MISLFFLVNYAIDLKLQQYCKLTILQQKNRIKINKLK